MHVEPGAIHYLEQVSNLSQNPWTPSDLNGSPIRWYIRLRWNEQPKDPVLRIPSRDGDVELFA